MSIVATLEAAQTAQGEIRASGTDLQERRRHGISQGPIVDIHSLEQLREIAWNGDGTATIGALVTIDTVANDPRMQEAYPALTLSAQALATPQIRAMASLGGALLQHTRCWYYRQPGFACYKKHDAMCSAREGDHRFGVVFDLSPCAHPHPSTLGMALKLYDAEVSINETDRRPIEALYGDGSDPTRDHLLVEGEILTHIHLPAPVADERAAYKRAISRAHAEWPLVEVAVRLLVDANRTITLARVGIGGVAHIPLRLPQVEALLTGQSASMSLLEQAAQTAIEGVKPLPMTEYKVELVAGTVFVTLQAALDDML